MSMSVKNSFLSLSVMNTSHVTECQDSFPYYGVTGILPVSLSVRDSFNVRVTELHKSWSGFHLKEGRLDVSIFHTGVRTSPVLSLVFRHWSQSGVRASMAISVWCQYGIILCTPVRLTIVFLSILV